MEDNNSHHRLSHFPPSFYGVTATAGTTTKGGDPTGTGGPEHHHHRGASQQQQQRRQQQHQHQQVQGLGGRKVYGHQRCRIHPLPPAAAAPLGQPSTVGFHPPPHCHLTAGADPDALPPPAGQTQTHRPTTANGLSLPPPPRPPTEVAAAPGHRHGSSFQLSPGNRVSYADAASGGALLRGGSKKPETPSPTVVPCALDLSSSSAVASVSDEPADPRASAGLFGSIGRRPSGGDGGGSSSDPDIFGRSLDEEKTASVEASVGGSSLVGNDRLQRPQDPLPQQQQQHHRHPSPPTTASGASFGSPIKMPPVGMSNGGAIDDCPHGLMSSPRASPSPRAPPQCGRRTGEHDRRPRQGGALDERHSSESSLVSSPRAAGKEEERDIHEERQEEEELEEGCGDEADTSLQSIQPCRNLTGMFEEMYVDAASSSNQRTSAATDKQQQEVDGEEGKAGEIGQTAISPSGVAELGVPGEGSSHPEDANNAKVQQLDASAGLMAPTDKEEAGNPQNAKILEECGATPLASGAHNAASGAHNAASAAAASTPSATMTAKADVPVPVLCTPAPAAKPSSSRPWDASDADLLRLPDFRLHDDLKRDLPQPLVNRVSFYGVVHDINKEAACMAANDHSAFHATGMAAAAAAAAAQAAFDAGQVPKEEARGPLVVAVNGPPPPDDDNDDDGDDGVPAAPVVGSEDGSAAAPPGSASTSAVIDEEIWLLSAIASRTAEEIESRGSAKCPPTFAEAMGEKDPGPTETATGHPAPPVAEDGNTAGTGALGGQTANPLTALSASRTQLWKPSRSWWEAKSGKNPWIEPKSHNKRWRYLWPLIHYHKFLARCIKKLKRNGVDVKTSVSPVSVFLREEVCFVSDHLASVSKFTSEEWMSCLQQFHGWTDPDPAAQAALRESISRQKLRTLSEPNDIQSPLLRNQIDEQFLRAMAAQREQMVNGDKMMAGQSKGKSSAQIIHEAQRKQPREPRPPQHGAGGAGLAEYQQGPMMHPYPSHYPPHFSGSYGHMFAGNVPMSHGYPPPPPHSNPTQSPGGKQQRGGRRNKTSQKGRRGQRGNRAGAANNKLPLWRPQHQYGAHPPYGMYQPPYGHAPTGQYMGYPGGGLGGQYYPPQPHHHSHQHHGGSHLSEIYPPHGHDGGGGYPMPSTYHSGQLMWPNGGAGLGPDMAGAAPTLPYSAPIAENAAFYGPPTPGTPAGPSVPASPHSLHHAPPAHMGGMEVMHPSQPHSAENGSGAGDQTPASQQVPLSPFWGDPRQYLDQDMISQILATPQGKQHVPSSPHRKEAAKGDGDGGSQRNKNSESCGKHAARNWNGGAKEASDGTVANANPLLINPYYQQPGAREGYVPPSPATQFMMGPPPSAYFQPYDSNGFGSPPPVNKTKHHHLPVVPDETTDASTTNDGGTGNEAAAATTASETPLAGDVTPPPPVRKITGNESPVADC